MRRTRDRACRGRGPLLAGLIALTALLAAGCHWPTQPTSPDITITNAHTNTVDVPPGPGTGPGPPPAPPDGTEEQASAPNLLHVVQRVATAYATDLAVACPSTGGTWAFLDRLVAALRAEDDRFGYNCKRGHCADLSEDVVSYYRGPGPPHSSTDVQLFDVIRDHCGATSQAQWLDVTGDGRWRYPR